MEFLSGTRDHIERSPLGTIVKFSPNEEGEGGGGGGDLDTQNQIPGEDEIGTMTLLFELGKDLII